MLIFCLVERSDGYTWSFLFPGKGARFGLVLLLLLLLLAVEEEDGRKKVRFLCMWWGEVMGGCLLLFCYVYGFDMVFWRWGA